MNKSILTGLAALGVMSGALIAQNSNTEAGRDWAAPQADAGGTRYSTLTQINTTNVQQLKRAWTFRTGLAGSMSSIRRLIPCWLGLTFRTTVLPSAETAAMLFWALLASGQITMRKVDGWKTLAEKPAAAVPPDLGA